MISIATGIVAMNQTMNVAKMPDDGERHFLAGILALPLRIGRNPAEERDPRADHREHEADVERRMRFQRRIERVEHARLAGEHRDRGHQRADRHQDAATSSAAEISGLPR